MKTAFYERQDEDTGAGPSSAIWADCPLDEIKSDPNKGCHLFDDFVHGLVPAASGGMGNWTAFLSSGGAVADGAAAGGVRTLSSDGDNEGAGICSGVGAFKICGIAGSETGKLWFEARIKSSTIADTKHGIFCGLMDGTAMSATVPIAADGTLADANLFGFHRLEGDGDKLDVVYKANGVTQVTAEADAITLEADTYIKVGFVWDPAAHTITVYANGVVVTVNDTELVAAVLGAAAGTVFPNDVAMKFVFIVLNATGTTPGSSSIDWVQIAQLR
jgi:hypothetical protein